MAKSGIRSKGKDGKIICLSPDVCLTPVGNSVVPIPYMIISKLSWAERTESNAGFGKQEAFTMNSFTTKVKGDEAGTKKGIVSGVHKKVCYPLKGKSSFTINGHKVIHDDCIFAMNAPKHGRTYNTIGKVYYSDE